MIVNMGEVERTQQALYNNLGIFSKVEYHFEQSSYLGRGRQSASHWVTAVDVVKVGGTEFTDDKEEWSHG